MSWSCVQARPSEEPPCGSEPSSSKYRKTGPPKEKEKAEVEDLVDDTLESVLVDDEEEEAGAKKPTVPDSYDMAIRDRLKEAPDEVMCLGFD